MLTHNDIYAILEQALKETQHGASVSNAFSTTLVLLGKDGALDSLDAMLFFDRVDELLTQKTGTEIILAGDDAFSRPDSPFQTMNTLADYIAELLRDR